jgi:hypothetical protein
MSEHIMSDTATEVSKRSPMDKAQSRLESEIAQLTSLVDTLSGKLDPVLRPGSDEANRPGDDPHVVQSPLVDVLETFGQRIGKVNHRLLELQERLEV